MAARPHPLWAAATASTTDRSASSGTDLSRSGAGHWTSLAVRATAHVRAKRCSMNGPGRSPPWPGSAPCTSHRAAPTNPSARAPLRVEALTARTGSPARDRRHSPQARTESKSCTCTARSAPHATSCLPRGTSREWAHDTAKPVLKLRGSCAPLRPPPEGDLGGRRPRRPEQLPGERYRRRVASAGRIAGRGGRRATVEPGD
jgi:hypothetical protein